MEQEKKIIASRIKKQESSPLSLATRWFTILSAIGDMGLTEREIQLLAFIAIKGNISYSTNREEFCTTYKSSSATINNMISKLKRASILINEGGKTKINPRIAVNFNNDIVLQLTLLHG